MSTLEQMKKWMDQHRAAIREDYFRFLRFKSISTDPSFSGDVIACAEWLSQYLHEKTGMKAEVIPTDGHPLVYAEDLRAGPKAPTLLFYGHYDVQPVDPLELWESDPFEPTERNGKIYARGAVDDKGQIFYAILAVRAWRELGRELPINLKFCIEGEEESGSLGLSKSLPKLKKKLKADTILVIDFGQFDPETPALTLGARGLMAMEVTVIGSKTDLHSGTHGGLAYNPNKALAQLLALLWDENGRVAVPGFYDDVTPLTSEERKLFSYSYTKERYSKEFGIEAFGGDQRLTLEENNVLQPTLEINGLAGGYFGPGFKTVIPAQAVAKISARLVPHQDPQKIFKQVSDFLQKHLTKGMKIKISPFEGAPAFRGNPDCELAKAVALAASEVMNKPCTRILCGGSIPVIAKMSQELQAEVVGMGYGLATDDIHAPNEHFDFPRLERGFLTVARALELV